MKGTLRLEVERMVPEDNDMDTFSETSSLSNGSGEGEGRLGESSLRSSGKLGRTVFNGRPKWTTSDRNESCKQRVTSFPTGSSPDHGSSDVRYLVHRRQSLICDRRLEKLIPRRSYRGLVFFWIIVNLTLLSIYAL